MHSSVDYSLMLRVWPAARGYFADYSHISEPELYHFFKRQVPFLSRQTWFAGLQALLRNGLLYKSSAGGLSFLPGDELQVFEPVIEPAWRRLWQYLKVHLSFPLGCLWSTTWLRPVLPPHQPVLVVEVNWCEVPTAIQILAQQSSYIPVDALTAVSSTSPANAQSLVVVQPRKRASPTRVINAVSTAQLEKILVDLPILFPDFAASVQDWQQQVEHYYQVNSERLRKYREQQEKQRTSNSKY